MPPKEGTSEYRSMKRVWRKYIQNCRRRNIFWEITLEQFADLSQSDCVYCGIPPRQVCRSYTYNGLDRMENKRGYVLENVVPCCGTCNSIKGSRLSFEEMVAVARLLKEMRRKR